MKKFILLFIVLAFVGIITAIYFLYFKKNITNSLKTVEYTLNGKTYHFLVASSASEWERGLMYYTKLDNADGMIFLFPDKQYRSFWNKNTYMDLDLYWLDGGRVVGKDFLPSILKSKTITIVVSSEPVNKVIEIPQK